MTFKPIPIHFLWMKGHPLNESNNKKRTETYKQANQKLINLHKLWKSKDKSNTR